MNKPKVILGSSYCDYSTDFSASVLRYIEEATNCSDVMGDFVSVELNANTGMLHVSTDSTHLPDMNEPVQYYLFVDGEEFEDLQVSNNNLTFVHQLPPINSAGEIPSYTITLVVASEDTSKGCTFEFSTTAVASEDYVLVQDGSTYTISLTVEMNEYTTLDLAEFDISWGIRNGNVLVNETNPSITISTASLYSITGSSTVVLYAKFGDITIYTDELGLPESEIDLAISLENVLNGTTFYTNAHVELTAGSNTVYTYLYLDNTLISDTHIPTVGNVGKTVTVVITLEENSVGNTFDEYNTASYFMHKTAIVTDDYELDMTMPTNSVLNNYMLSSQNPNRSLLLPSYVPFDNFNDMLNYKQPVELANVYDSTDIITVVDNSIGLDVNNIRAGLIIEDEYYDAALDTIVTGLRVYDEDLELQVVDRGLLVNKRVEEVNRLNTLICGSVASLSDLGFTGDISSYYNISDKYIGFNSDTSSVISKDFTAQSQVLYGVQFELEYGHIASSIPVFIVIRIYSTDGSLHSTYVYEKIEEGKMKLTDAKANISVSEIDSGSEYISKSFANIYDIARLDIQVSGGQSAQLAIRNLYIDVMEEG